jgi:hypothetical protein
LGYEAVYCNKMRKVIIEKLVDVVFPWLFYVSYITIYILFNHYYMTTTISLYMR